MTLGLQLPQTLPILNTEVYYLQLLSLYMGTHRRHAFVASVCECVCVSTLCVRTMYGLVIQYLRKKHVAYEVLEVILLGVMLNLAVLCALHQS